ncbi:uncharacterized protein [Heterodontus francisci]|uniref:uncharacterized protein n=1 Tax=Heterodontus francisci TaxID=7792 RepID=UPI00355BF29B
MVESFKLRMLKRPELEKYRYLGGFSQLKKTTEIRRGEAKEGFENKDENLKMTVLLDREFMLVRVSREWIFIQEPADQPFKSPSVELSVELTFPGDDSSTSVLTRMESSIGSVESGLSRMSGQALAISKSKSEDSGVEVSNTEACCPSIMSSERRLSRTVSLCQIWQVCMATPLARHQSEVEVQRDPLPSPSPVHQKLQRAHQRTLSRKQREAIQPWDGGPALPDRLDIRQSLLSLKPLAQSQPVLTSCGEGTLRGSRYTPRRVPISNSMNNHPEAPRSSSRAPGLKYLQQVCRLLDRIADLQEMNSLLRQEKLEMEEQLRRKEKQQELLQYYCSCGSAALLLESAAQTRLCGHKDSLRHIPNSTTSSHSPPHFRHHRHDALQKRWASDSVILCEANGASMLNLDEGDSCHYGIKDDLASRIHEETCPPDTDRITKDSWPHWDRMRDLLHRLKGKHRRGGSFVAKFKGSTHQNQQ